MADSNTEEKSAGAAYVEDPDFVPRPTDMHGVMNTTGLGSPPDLAAVSPIVEVDRRAVAEQVKAALDDDDTTVPKNRVIFPEPTILQEHDQDRAEKDLLTRADNQLKKPVEPGMTASERQAAEADTPEDARAEGQGGGLTTSTSPADTDDKAGKKSGKTGTK